MGSALARRWTSARHAVQLAAANVHDSIAAAQSIREELGVTNVEGTTVEKAVRRNDIIVVALPYQVLEDVLDPVRAAARGKVVLCVVNPMTFIGGVPSTVNLDAGSAAEHCQQLLPESWVVAGLHHVSHRSLAGSHLSADVILCGDSRQAVATISELVSHIPGLRPLDGGALSNARGLEAFTSVLLSLNTHYKSRTSVSIRGISLPTVASPPSDRTAFPRHFPIAS